MKPRTYKAESKAASVSPGIRIAVDASRNRSGGSRAYFLGVFANLDPADYGIREIHFWGPKELLESLKPSRTRFLHFNSYDRQGMASQLFWQKFLLPRELQKLEIDVLFSTDATTVARYKKQVVLSQDLLAYEGGERWRKKFPLGVLRQSAIRVLQRKSLRAASGAIFLTNYAARLFEERFGRVDHLVIPHALSEKAKVKPGGSGSSQPWELLYVSPISPHKNHNFVIRALSILSRQGVQFRMSFVGGGDRVAVRKLSRLAEDLGLSENQVLFHGHSPPEKIRRHLEESQVVIFASSAEAFGITLLEAMAAGKPIACSSRSSLPETLKDGGLYFDPMNPVSISSCIEVLLEDQQLRDRIAARSLELSKEYAWEDVSAKTVGYILAFLRGGSAQPLAKRPKLNIRPQ